MDGVTRRLQRLQPRTWRKVIILLTLLALIDGYLLVRAYVMRNADTVVILATDYNNRYSPTDPGAGPDPLILGHTTLRYTGDTAHQIQQAINSYPFLVPSDTGHFGCAPSASDHTYHYQFTFLLAGIVVEVMDADSSSCSWPRTVLGLPEQATFTDGGPLGAIYQLTNGALPG